MTFLNDMSFELANISLLFPPCQNMVGTKTSYRIQDPSCVKF